MPKFDTVTLPANWVLYLVNGEDAELSDADRARIDSYCWSHGIRVVAPVEGSEPSFTRMFRIYGGDTACGEILDYTAEVFK